jgi:hypothetical protein
MAHTDIILTEQRGVFTPSQPQVPVVKGDSISFSTSGGVPVALFFSPAAAAVLSPAPSVPTMVAQGGEIEFTFTTSDAGAYSVFFETSASEAPSHYPVRPSNMLLLEIDMSHAGGFSGSEVGTRE